MTSQTLDMERTVVAEPRIVPPLWRLVINKANPITPLNNPCAGSSFYCVHPIAGDVTSFRALAQHLDGTVRFHGIQVPREKMNAEFGSSVTEMAHHYATAISVFQPEGAIYLGGWSAGAIIALEIAQQLRQAGRSVPLLVALDGAPCNTNTAISFWHPVFVIKVLQNLPFWVWDEIRQAESWSGLISNLRAKLAFRVRRTVPVVRNDQTLHGDVVQTLLDSRSWSHSQMAFIKAFYEAMRCYHPTSYDGPVLVIESRTQPLFSLRQVGPAWKKVSPQAEIVRLKSNHMGIFREPSLTALAGHIRDRLRGGLP